VKKQPNISPEIIEAYIAGTLSHAQTHEFEKTMLNDVVLRDMVEGYEISKEKKVDLSKVNASLSRSLQDKINKEETEIYPLWKRVPLYARAASVVLFLGLGIYILTTKNETDSTEKIVSISPQKEEKIAQSEPQISTPNSSISKERVESEMAKIATENKVAILQKKAKTKSVFIENDSQVAVKEYVMSDVGAEMSKPAPPVVAYEAPTVVAVPAPSAVMKSEGGSYARKAASPSSIEYQKRDIVSGIVLDEDSKKPVPNVSIFSDEKAVGKTDEKGQFKLDNSVIGNKIKLVAPDFENAEININQRSSDFLFIQPKAELIFIDLKRNKTWKYNPSEHPAQPSVSPDDYLDYLKKAIRKPNQVIENQIVGDVVVEFKVNKDGGLSEFKIIKSLGLACDEEAIRVIKEGPVWLPKMSSGEPRRQRVRQEISF
jgi:TonB family protein